MAIVEGEGAIDGLIGDKILPPMPINRRTAHILKMGIADTQALRIISGNKWLHAPGTKFERIVVKFGDSTMSVDLRGVELVIPNEIELDWAGYLSVEAIFTARFGRETSGLTREALIAAAIFSTTNFGSATNSAVAYTTANASTNSFFGDIIAAIRRGKARGERYDTIAMSGPVYERVRQSVNVLQYTRGLYGAGLLEVTEAVMLNALKDFGIKQILIGDAYYNSAADGATPVLTAIWSDAYIWVGKAGKVSGTDVDGVAVPQLGGVGADIYWEGYTPGGVPSVDKDTTSFAGGNFCETYPSIEIDSMIVRLKMSNKPFIGNSRAGELIATSYV